jgi:hypothetical protein
VHSSRTGYIIRYDRGGLSKQRSLQLYASATGHTTRNWPIRCSLRRTEDLPQFNRPKGAVGSFSADGGTSPHSIPQLLLAVGSTDGDVRVVSEHCAARHFSSLEFYGIHYCILISPHRAACAFSQFDATDTNSVSPLFQQLSGHTGRVYGVHFHPQELALASCSQDGTAAPTPHLPPPCCCAQLFHGARSSKAMQNASNAVQDRVPSYLFTSLGLTTPQVPHGFGQCDGHAFEFLAVYCGESGMWPLRGCVCVCVCVCGGGGRVGVGLSCRITRRVLQSSYRYHSDPSSHQRIGLIADAPRRRTGSRSLPVHLVHLTRASTAWYQTRSRAARHSRAWWWKPALCGRPLLWRPPPPRQPLRGPVRTHPSSVARSGYQPGPQSVWGSCRHRIPSSVRAHGTSTPPHRTAPHSESDRTNRRQELNSHL